ncbi:DUF1552 domain-containing protein [Prosthecobacter sp.]|uniref:DUF1552 domain-containing protein n=1 Tax=Prosthecobacter sp. TaxID=1965333 RepID=UPI0037846759
MMKQEHLASTAEEKQGKESPASHADGVRCPHCGKDISEAAGTGYLTAKAKAKLRDCGEFLVGDADVLPLRVFEILFTLTFLAWMGQCFRTWEEWLTEAGFHLTASELNPMGYPAPFELLTGPGVAGLAGVIGLSGLLMILNKWRRLALLGLFASAVYVQGADTMSAFTLNKLYVAVYGILLMTPGYIWNASAGRFVGSVLGLRVIQATLLLQYLAAGVGKAFKGDWLKYSDVLHTQVQGVYRTNMAAWLLRVLPAWSWTVMQWMSLLFELEAPVLFCIRKLRPIGFVLGIGFHVVIALVMKDLIFFSAQMITFYALFVSADEWRWLGRKAVRAWKKTGAAVMPGTLAGSEPTAVARMTDESAGALAVNIGRSGSRRPSRRLFLTGAGVTVALPVLVSVADRFFMGRRGVGSRAGVKSDQPMRLVCVGNAFGFYQPAFWPKKTGRGYDLPPLLRPLAEHRNDFTLFSGLDHGLKGGHWAVSAFLSGIRTIDAKSREEHNMTLDQYAAETVGGATRFPALTVGSEGGLLGGCMMCWTRAGNRVPPISGAKELFRRLFISDSAREREQTRDHFALQGSILDVVRDNARSLERQMGKQDVEKLDEYFTSVREVEKQIELRKRWVEVEKPKPTMPEPDDQGLVGDLPVLYDLIALALQTDSTRVATLEIAGGFEAAAFGVKRDYHALSHHGQVPENIEGLVKLETYQMEQFARFLGKMKSIRDGDGTLLDHAMVLFGSGMANANAHTNDNLPIILGGGGFAHGEHRGYSMLGLNKQPLCNLYVTLLQRFGLEAEAFGTSKGTLTGFA